LRRSDQVIEPRKQWPPNALVTYGWREELEQSYKQKQVVPFRYGVMGLESWSGKYQDGYFEDFLVQVQLRWYKGGSHSLSQLG